MLLLLDDDDIDDDDEEDALKGLRALRVSAPNVLREVIISQGKLSAEWGVVRVCVRGRGTRAREVISGGERCVGMQGTCSL
jgi:hypothetical protein